MRRMRCTWIVLVIWGRFRLLGFLDRRRGGVQLLRLCHGTLLLGTECWILSISPVPGPVGSRLGRFVAQRSGPTVFTVLLDHRTWSQACCIIPQLAKFNGLFGSGLVALISGFVFQVLLCLRFSVATWWLLKQVLSSGSKTWALAAYMVLMGIDPLKN